MNAADLRCNGHLNLCFVKCEIMGSQMAYLYLGIHSEKIVKSQMYGKKYLELERWRVVFGDIVKTDK